MKYTLNPVDPQAEDMLKPAKNDRSGIGVHYVDASLKPLKSVTLEDGTRFSAKRRGLKITLIYGDRKGSGLMRRLTVSKDPKEMFTAALKEAGQSIDAELKIEQGNWVLETRD